MIPTVINSEDLTQTAFDLTLQHLRMALAERDRAAFVLSGGSTPLRLYERLRSADLSWERIHLFWGDERFVAPDHEDSNYGAAQRVLLSGIDIPAANVHPWPILDTPEASAAAYSDVLHGILGAEPEFDLTLLGLGADCHTASLFPGTDVLQAEGLTVSSWPPASVGPRLSLTAAALSSSRTAMFLVSGSDKAEALSRLLDANVSPEQCPARAVSALDELLLVTDLKQ
jgi:6-phosphogluconolactonase